MTPIPGNYMRKFEIKTPELIMCDGAVVMSWSEEPFFQAIFERLRDLKPRSVLEVGFGLGISAGLIQEYLTPRHHDIVELDKAILSDLNAFARTRRGVRAIDGDFWEFKSDRRYDFVFYDIFNYDDDDDDDDDDGDDGISGWARRLVQLLAPGGTICVPVFGDESPTRRLPGFKRTRHERLTVPPYLLEDGTETTTGAFECFQRLS
jgi:SAM-dependent methyltransferase